MVGFWVGGWLITVGVGVITGEGESKASKAKIIALTVGMG